MNGLAALLDELVAMIQSAKVKRDGTVYAAPLDYWANAFNEYLPGEMLEPCAYLYQVTDT